MPSEFGPSNCSKCGYAHQPTLSCQSKRELALVTRSTAGPDAKHPNWERDEKDDAYTSMREGCFSSWEEFARFIFAANKKLRAKTPAKSENLIETLVFQSALNGDHLVVFAFDDSAALTAKPQPSPDGVKHYSIPRKAFIKFVMENK